MAEINLQCNNHSQTHSSVFFRLNIVCILEGSAEPSLAKIRQEMSELLEKQVNAQKESLKKSSVVHASSCKPTKKVCDENERNRQEKTMHV